MRLKKKYYKYLLLVLGLVMALQLSSATAFAINEESVFVYGTPALSVGSIGGTISCAETGEGVEGVSVTLIDSASGVMLADTNTDEDGAYLFTKLFAGEYTVTVNTETLPESCTVLSIGPDGQNNNSSSISLDKGEDNLDHDFAYVSAQMLGSIGDQIWCDTNDNGALDTDEGIANVSVVLVNNENVSITTTTDSQGAYLFENLVDGSYVVTVDIGSLPATCNGTSADPDGQLSSSQITVALGEGENNLEQDFTYVPQLATALAAVGNYVWLDQNTNGIQDESEVRGVAGITVKLYDAATNTVLLQTTTNSSGLYLFGDLQPGDYFIRYQLPDQYRLSPQGAGSTEHQDSNADPMSGKTEIFTLTAGLSNLTVDQGVYVPTALSIIAQPQPTHDIAIEPQISHAVLLPLMNIQ